ncbi:MAG: TIGR01906 family membrane protein [Chloroflexota bacterium]|nr:TIGR01906 family membrane protein [Chloroflexota bacterium]
MANRKRNVNEKESPLCTRWPRLIQWLIVLSLPIFLLLSNTRIATGHWFIHWEYGKEDFPPDPYGLSTAERIPLAETCVDYLATGADISLLGDLQLPNGEPAFNQRELRHMFDVQVVYGHLMTARTIAALALAGGIGALLAQGRTRWRTPAALLHGSALTLGLLGAVGAYMALSWGEFFTTFHRIFFEGETWIFDYSDTLIRLFPIRFWMDVAAVIVGLLVVEALALGGVAWMWAQRLTSRSQLDIVGVKRET